MAVNNSVKKLAVGLFAAAGLFACHAQSLSWDPGHTGGSGGTGTWDFATANWWNGAADVVWSDHSANGTNGASFAGTAGTVTLNTSLSASNLQFTAAGYTLSGSGTITLGAGGIDASAVNSGTTTIGTALSLPASQQPWQVGPGGTLAINGAVARSLGASVDFSSSGVTTTAPSFTNDAGGILDGWATSGNYVSSTASGDFVTVSNGNVIICTNYTAVSTTSNTTPNVAGISGQNLVSGVLGGNNYITTITNNVTLNSLVPQGDFSVSDGATLTLASGGLMLRGTSRWLLDNGGGNLGTAAIESGLASGELFIHAPNGGTGNWTIWPLIKDNGATPLILVKDGPGLAKLANNNTYSGGTIVNAGSLGSRCAAPTGVVSPFGSGSVTAINGGLVELGTDPGNAFGSYRITNNVTLNNGSLAAFDGSQRVLGNVTIGPGGAAMGSTFDAPWENFAETNFPKALFIDGFVTGTGNLTIQDSPFGQTGNAWNTSCTVFTSQGTAAQNTYSGTITVNPLTVVGSGGSYLYLVGPSALANATITLTGDNLAASARMGVSTLLFGNGSVDGPGYATIGGLAGSGDLLLNDTMLFTGGSGYSNGIPVALSVGYNNASTTYSGVMSGTGSLIKVGSGTLTLSAANTYTGDTTVNGGRLTFAGSFVNSTNIIVGQGATLDVSALGSVTLSGSQILYGGGTVNGTLNTTTGSKIYAGTDGGYGTNAVTGSLTLATGVSPFLDLGTVYNGANDLITVGGTLAVNNNSIHLKAPSTLVNLDSTADYVLFSSPNTISGSFATAPSWDVAPANSAHYSIVTGTHTVTLHYSAVTGPTGVGSATPSPALRNQNVVITVTTVNGTAGTVSSVTVDASPIGGSSTLALVNAGGNVWTNTVAVSSGTLAGSYTLVATATDTGSLQGSINIPLSVTIGNDVWNGAGADDNFSTALNWTNQLAPGYVGDSLEFAGATRLTPNMDNNYTITSLLFDSGAGSFNIGSGSTLTFSGNASIFNNSANAQTLNLSIADVGNVGFTKSGNAVNLPGSVTLGGSVRVNSGVLTLSGADTANNVLVGNQTNGVAAVYQTGGSLSAVNNTGFDNFSIGNIIGSYGYYDAAGGSATINGIAVAGEDNNGSTANFNNPAGNGVMDVNGGNVNCTGWFVMTRNANAQMGVLNIYSGSLTYAGGGLVCNWGSGQTAVINVLGGSVTSVSQGIGLGGSGTCILNLDGGLVGASVVGGNFGGTFGQLNFNGGILQPNVNTTTFVKVTRATVYGGGAIIDVAGWPTGIGQALTAPTGNGVSGITSFTGGAGYIAPPIVTITPGAGDTTGTGATAIAQIDPAAGIVTNILITCPGMNYTATPTFTFTGGGAVTPASVTGATLAPNVSGGLTLIDSYNSGVTLTLSGVNTYTGNTTVSNNTLALTQTGSLSSTNIITESGTTFDVSGFTNAPFVLGSGQALSGYGNVNGAVNTSAGSEIYGGTDGTYGTNTFNNNLTLVSGAACYLDLGTAYNGSNDQIVVNGTLTANGNSIHIKAPSTSSSLDTTADYVLITSANPISGSFASAPVWDVIPANAGHYTIVTSGNTVTLHYNAAVNAPVLSVVANPTTLVRNQPTVITANVTPGGAAISTVTVDLTSIGGSVVSLVQSNASNIYTNAVAIPAAAAPGGANVTVTATDTSSQSGSAAVSLTINATTEVWNGVGSGNWSDNTDWASGYAPGYLGDTLLFAGSVGLTPNVDTNYSITGLTFSNNASSFTIGTANNSALTLTANGIVNNSANAQTINVPVKLSAVEPINAAAGNITLGSTVSGAGGITKSGTGTLTLSGSGSSLSGNLTVTGGALNMTGGSTAFGTSLSYVGYEANSGTLNISGGSFTNSGELWVGGSDLNGTAYNAVGTLTVSGGANVSLGKLTVARGNNNQNTVSGTVTVNSGSSLSSENDILLGFAGAGSDKVIVNGGTLSIASATTRWVILGQWDTTSSEIDINSGQMNINANTAIRFATSGNNGTNTFNLNGGAVTFFSDNATTVGGTGVLDLHQGNGTTVVNTFNLNGGILTVPGVISANSAGTRSFNFNGGTLKAAAANASFMSLGSGNAAANVRNGGAIIDDSGFSVGISQPLQHSAIAGDNATDGGLTKLGAGTLSLGGANTYNGNTTVSAGTLEIAQAVIATNSTVSVANGATLKLDFATTNQVGALVLNGVTQSPGVYNSATTPAYLAGTGSLLVASTIASNPTNITFSVSGNTLTLSWPADHTGWILQAQTNQLNAGLQASSNLWFDVAGSSNSNTNIVTVDPANPTVFYRLRHP